LCEEDVTELRGKVLAIIHLRLDLQPVQGNQTPGSRRKAERREKYLLRGNLRKEERGKE